MHVPDKGPTARHLPAGPATPTARQPALPRRASSPSPSSDLHGPRPSCGVPLSPRCTPHLSCGRHLPAPRVSGSLSSTAPAKAAPPPPPLFPISSRSRTLPLCLALPSPTPSGRSAEPRTASSRPPSTGPARSAQQGLLRGLINHGPENRQGACAFSANAFRNKDGKAINATGLGQDHETLRGARMQDRATKQGP